MKDQHQYEALQNAVNGLNLDGLRLLKHTEQDKRKTTPKFFLMLNSASISPKLDYDKMNHFILGLKRGVEISKTEKL